MPYSQLHIFPQLRAIANFDLGVSLWVFSAGLSFQAVILSATYEPTFELSAQVGTHMGITSRNFINEITYPFSFRLAYWYRFPFCKKKYVTLAESKHSKTRTDEVAQMKAKVSSPDIRVQHPRPVPSLLHFAEWEC